LEVYRWNLERFFVVCEGRGLTPGLTRMDLLNYLAGLAQQGYQASTRARKTIAILRFFQFLAEGGMLTPNPLRRCLRPAWSAMSAGSSARRSTGHCGSSPGG
jgi:site-specific recombinase XerD